MNVDAFIVGSLSTNCYIVTCEKTGAAAVIDPGGVSYTMLDHIREIRVESILLTHGHFDHIAGIGRLPDIDGVPIHIHEADAPLLQDPFDNGSFMIGEQITAPPASVTIGDGDIVMVGESPLRVVATPGHTRGGVSFVGDTFVISGDTLFRLSVGRWDLPGGNFDTLLASLRAYLDLADDMIVYPGHGDPSTIGYEKNHNEFMIGL